jgi:diguanylate cyclase (GGDEF)-like protein
MQPPPKTCDETARLTALHATGQLDTPIEERFEVVTRLARRIFDIPIAAISLIDANRQWFKSINGLDAQETTRDVSFCGHTIVHNDVLIIDDAREDPRFADNPLVTGEPHIVFYAGCPIRSECGSNIATLCVIGRQPKHLSEHDVEILRDLAVIAQQQLEHSFQQSVACDLVSQIEVEQRKALIDTLTRLWNRGGIEDLLARQVDECHEDRAGAAVIVTDIDEFKRINDRFGHPVGDQVLREIARRLLAGARQGDSVGRHGGEEFLIVPGGCNSLGEVTQLAERLRLGLAEKPVQTDAGPIDVTASFGVAFAPPDRPAAADADALVAEADGALYRAKADGRNCVRSQTLSQSAA